VDHSEPPGPIDGALEAMLAMRDVASGEQRLWHGVEDMTAAVTVRELEAALAHHAPLVVKSDLGPAFRAREFQRLLERHGVAWLPSPAYTPRYNGACEAGIGQLKKRTAYQALRAGRSGVWKSEDLELARAYSNILRRVTSAQPLDAAPPSPSERRRFLREVARRRVEVAHEMRLAAEKRPAIMDRAIDDNVIQRRAVVRALCAQGLLKIRRGRVSLPFHWALGARIW